MARLESNDPASEPTVHVETEDARQGETTGHVRWVLRLSVVFSILVVFGVWAYFALTPRHVTESHTAMQRPAAQGASRNPSAGAGNGPAAVSGTP